MSLLDDPRVPLPRQHGREEARWRQTLDRAIDFAMPAPCLSCLQKRSGTAIGLCYPCAHRLRACSRHRCLLCFEELVAGRPCLHHGHDSTLPDLLGPFEYDRPIDAVIRGLKFGRMPRLAGALADLTPPEVLDRLAECEALAPIPLSPSRRWQRGFNQSLLIAERMAERIRLPVVQPLRRTGWRAPQSALPRARRPANVSSVFVTRPDATPTRVALVDDVVTSGATLEAASRCLVAAGFEVPLVFVLARTPKN